MVLSRGWIWAGRALLVCLALIAVMFLPELLASSWSAAARGGVIAAVAAFLAVWAWFWTRGVSSPRPLVAGASIAVVTALAAPLTLVSPSGRDAMFYAALAAGAGLPARRAAPAAVAVAVLAGVLQVAHGSGVPVVLFAVVNDLVIGVAAIGGRLLLLTNRELLRARAGVALLATHEERLRLARDLHDLIGRNLTVAILKTELVLASLPAETDPALKGDLEDATAATRRALDDVRSVVAGYRQPSLEGELASAGEALRAAGIRLVVENRLGAMAQAPAGVLAWAVREATTNVLRHSRATTFSITLRREGGRAVLHVEDDGVGGTAGTAGSGLRGIAERAAALGGSLQTSTGNPRGFALTVSVPAAEP
ncbi:MAG TPA: histidine kinase [Candidatus Dormibacteraeota bacterium]|nr:histidine kinase [Candidatus Dormibacteraeota bacterium]